MLKLQWLQINKFRAVKPGTRLVFNPTFNVLLGQNGAGKTTLLNLVAAIVSSNFTSLQNEEFDLEYELASDKGRVRANVRNTRSPASKIAILGTVAAEDHISEDLDAPTLSAEFKVTAPDGESAFIISLDGARVTIRREDAAVDDVVEGNVPKLSWLWVILRVAPMWVRKPRNREEVRFVVDLYFEFRAEREIARFDESLVYFEKLKTSRFVLVKMKESEEVHMSGTVAPDVLIAELKRLAKSGWGSQRYAPSAEQMPFLKAVAQLLGFESAEAIVELQESNLLEDGENLHFGNLRFLFVRPDGSRVSEQLLSYGQKRMLAFMYYQATARSVVISDELVNGLHHGWIRACIETLGERQVFLTSQNPLLLDYLTFDSPEQVRSTFVLCRWAHGTGGGQMLWEDMSQESSEDFFASYKVGFQQVGELLQSKGLW
jgi:energy-coupling factor transporter ATP-binding protein EcfA2